MKADLVLGGLVVVSLAAVTVWPRPDPEQQPAGAGPAERGEPGPEATPGARQVLVRVVGPERASILDGDGDVLAQTDEDGRATLLLPDRRDEVWRVEAEGFLPTGVRTSDLQRHAATAAQTGFVVTLAPRAAPPPGVAPGSGDQRRLSVQGPEGPAEDCVFELFRGGRRVHAGRLDANGQALLPSPAGGAAGDAGAETTWLVLRPAGLGMVVSSWPRPAGRGEAILLDRGGSVTFEMPGIRRQPAVFHNLEVVDQASGLLLQVEQPDLEERYRLTGLPLDRALTLRRRGRDDAVQIVRQDLVLEAGQRDLDLGRVPCQDESGGRP